MNSAHYRSASATESRSTYTNGMPARINSTRVRDYEHPRVQENGSPVLSDHGFEHENGSTVNKFATERRRERYTVTNTETYTTACGTPTSGNRRRGPRLKNPQWLCPLQRLNTTTKRLSKWHHRLPTSTNTVVSACKTSACFYRAFLCYQRITNSSAIPALVLAAAKT